MPGCLERESHVQNRGKGKGDMTETRKEGRERERRTPGETVPVGEKKGRKEKEGKGVRVKIGGALRSDRREDRGRTVLDVCLDGTIIIFFSSSGLIVYSLVVLLSHPDLSSTISMVTAVACPPRKWAASH